jgi:hypothetical protein
MKRTTFAALEIGPYFNANGNRCQKVSTRTALLVSYGRVFYFNHYESVRL